MTHAACTQHTQHTQMRSPVGAGRVRDVDGAARHRARRGVDVCRHVPAGKHVPVCSRRGCQVWGGGMVRRHDEEAGERTLPKQLVNSSAPKQRCAARCTWQGQRGEEEAVEGAGSEVGDVGGAVGWVEVICRPGQGRAGSRAGRRWAEEDAGGTSETGGPRGQTQHQLAAAHARTATQC